jgi:hypothetical protein
MVTAMLMVECSNCQEWIRSPFLLEIKETKCPGCKEVVPVTELYISAGPYAISREALLKSMSKYKRLVADAENELKDYQKRNTEPYDASLRTVKKFVENLKEMLDGGRVNPRSYGHRVLVECTIIDVAYNSELVNISAAKTSLRFWGEEPFCIEGMVTWVGRENNVGIKFLDMDESTIKQLHNYILEMVPEPKIDKKIP